MKRLLGILIVGVLAWSAAYFYIQPITYASSTLNFLPTSLYIERDILPLGTVKYGEKRQVAFRLSKTSVVPLLVHDVRPFCSGTSVEWTR